MKDPELTMEILLQLLTPSGLGTLAVDTSGQDDMKPPSCRPATAGGTLRSRERSGAMAPSRTARKATSALPRDSASAS